MPRPRRSLALSLLAAMLWFAPAAAHNEVPTLPFANNPDPDRCGIPTPVGGEMHALLHATYEGEVEEEMVHLVASHLRHSVTGHVPAGSVVTVVLYQDNPELDFYFVEWRGPDGIESGWVPAPYLELGASAP